MKWFTTTDNAEDFKNLHRKLDAKPGVTQVYHGIQLPHNCDPSTVRLGFQANRKRDGSFSYKVYIDHASYTGNNLMFSLWLRDGDWVFPDWDSVLAFFHSQLKNL